MIQDILIKLPIPQANGISALGSIQLVILLLSITRKQLCVKQAFELQEVLLYKKKEKVFQQK